MRRFERWIDPVIDRARLPRNPGAPVMQVVIGLVGIAWVGSLMDSELMGVRPIAVAMIAIAASLVIPALGMLLIGAWSLAREPLRHFQPEWYARLATVPRSRGGRARATPNAVRVAGPGKQKRIVHVRASPVHRAREGQRRPQRQH